MKKSEHIYPIHDRLLQRADKENLLQQRGIVLWMSGLSGSGKSTVARHLENQLYQKAYLTQILDGDNLRSGLNCNLGFSEEDRNENIRRTAEVARMFANAGIVTIVSLITPTEKIREMIRQIIPDELRFEVFINSPLEVCEARDPKGLYQKARKGEIRQFTGIDSPFEIPKRSDLTLDTHTLSEENAVSVLLEAVLPRILMSERS